MNGMNQVDKEGAMAAGVEVLGKREVWRMRRGRWVCCVCRVCGRKRRLAEAEIAAAAVAAAAVAAAAMDGRG